jgi:ABC-type phosphate transport system substrate-binding protein
VRKLRIGTSRIVAVGTAILAVAGSVAPAAAVPTFPLQLYVNGSTTVYPIANANAGAGGPFAAAFGSGDTVVNFGRPGSPAVSEQPGSGAGRNCLLMGQIDVANSSGTFGTADNTQSTAFNISTPGFCNNPAPNSPTTFQYPALVDVYTVAEDALVPIINTSSAGMPSTVSRDQMADIFGCQVTTWNQVGAASTATIFPQPRENTSGTYDSQNKLTNLPFGAEQACMGDLTYHNPNGGGGTLTDIGGTKVTPAEGQAIGYPVHFKGPHGGATVYTINGKNPNALSRQISAPDIVTKVGSTQNSIGYVGLGNGSGAGISVLQVEGIAGSITTVHNCFNGGTPCFPMNRKLYMAMLKYGNNGARFDTYARGTDFIDQVLSPAGQTMVQNAGFVPLIDQGRILDADVNMDFIVDISDLALIGLSGTWSTGAGAAHPHWVRADVNRDGAIDIADLAQIGFASNWNHSWALPQK